MPFYKVMTTGGAYTQGQILNIEDQELFAIVSRDVFLQPIDPTAVNIENALYGTTGIGTFPTRRRRRMASALRRCCATSKRINSGKIDERGTLGSAWYKQFPGLSGA